MSGLPEKYGILVSPLHHFCKNEGTNGALFSPKLLYVKSFSFSRILFTNDFVYCCRISKQTKLDFAHICSNFSINYELFTVEHNKRSFKPN